VLERFAAVREHPDGLEEISVSRLHCFVLWVSDAALGCPMLRSSEAAFLLNL